MRSFVCAALFTTAILYASEPAKEETQKKLEEYVRSNQRASAQIFPTIKWIREMLGYPSKDDSTDNKGDALNEKPQQRY